MSNTNLYEVKGQIFNNKKQVEYFKYLIKNKNFNSAQLKEIGYGVRQGLNVDYAKEFYDFYKMKVTRNSLIYNVEIEYGFEVPNKKFLNKVISGFKKKVNILPYLLKYPELTISKNNIIDLIIYGLTLNISNIHYYLNKKYDEKQLYEIFKGIENKIDVTFYNKIEFNSRQMRQIRLGLEKSLDVTIYAKPKYSYEKMWQIREGLEQGLNVSVYAKPEFYWVQMREIRLGLEHNIDVSDYTDPKFDDYQMNQIRLGLQDKLDINVYLNPEFTWQQMREIRVGLKKNLNISIYANPEFTWQQMKHLRKILELKLK